VKENEGILTSKFEVNS